MIPFELRCIIRQMAIDRVNSELEKWENKTSKTTTRNYFYQLLVLLSKVARFYIAIALQKFISSMHVVAFFILFWFSAMSVTNSTLAKLEANLA